MNVYRFEILRIDSRPHERFIEIHLKTLPPAYKNWDEWESERKVREKLAAYAFQYQFQEAVDLVKEHKETIPNLINSTRPDSSKFWTLGHQIAHSNNKHANKMGGETCCFEILDRSKR